MRVVIETVPHAQQRYETCGDWQWDGETLNIRVSGLGDWRKEMAVAVHELVESLIAKQQGISEAEVDEFDMNYEANRPEGDTSEPGDDPECPIHAAHCIATAVERMLIPYLELSWREYEDAIGML